MSVYANCMNIHMNEVIIIEFKENNQMGNQTVASVAMTYENVKAFHEGLGRMIDQHDKKLHELQRTKANMN